MSLEPKTYSLHFVGLGGTGTNIIEAAISSEGIYDYLRTEGVRMSCFALDVADHDIQSLNRKFDKFLVELKSKGIPSEKVTLIANSVKFPTPEAMFEYVEKVPQFIKQEGGKVPENYKPWLSSALEVPPLSGGVGRRRSLSKAIYGLNFYYLKLIDTYAERLKESVSSSILQPVIIVIFGVGGGSGSGMAMDFVRHLRKKLGSGYPILGLAVLPCTGDDPAAKGASAYAAMTELDSLLNRGKNEAIKKEFGDIYENPYSAFLTMPLGPVFGRSGNLIDAKQLIDEAIVDIIMNTMRFDLSDLLNNIGSNIDQGPNWVHAITSLKINYPIDEHISLVKLSLETMDKLRVLRTDKLEMVGVSAKSEVGGLQVVFSDVYNELAKFYKMILLQKNIYEEENFDKALTAFIYEDQALEINHNMQLKSSEEAIRTLADEIATPIASIGLDASEGTPEARIRLLVGDALKTIRSVTTTEAKFSEFAKGIIDDMEQSIAGAQKMTFREKLLLNDLIDLVRLVDGYLKLLRRYMECKSLAERLLKELAKLERSEEHQDAIQGVQRILNPELVILFSLLPTILSSPDFEIKGVDAHLSDCRVMKRIVTEQIEKEKVAKEGVEGKMRVEEGERESASTALDTMKFSMFKVGKKRMLEDNLDEFDHRVKMLSMDLQDLSDRVDSLTAKLGEYLAIEKKLDVNSDYRRNLRDVSEMQNSYYDRLNDISRDRGYYNRVGEVTVEERSKIMSRILRDQESTLTRETIINEIIDRRRFKEYLSGVMRILRLPSSLGVKASYRTDYIWVTVVAPRGVWDQDLELELKTTLSGYISGDASRCISIREIDSSDPWTLRFLIVASKAKLQDLESYAEMKSLYDGSSPTDRKLASSFLLEQGKVIGEEFSASE